MFTKGSTATDVTGSEETGTDFGQNDQIPIPIIIRTSTPAVTAATDRDRQTFENR
jgi:hypothetical protein